MGGVEVAINIGQKVSRRVALHEAGHAVAAWFLGSREVEIALAGTERVAHTLLGGAVSDCRGVAIHLSCSPRSVTDLHKSAFDLQCNRDSISRGIIVALAGVVAESAFCGIEISELLKAGGKSDAESIQNLIEVYAATGVTDLETKNIYQKSLIRAENLVAYRWWEIIAVAKILEYQKHIRSHYFSSVMGMLDLDPPHHVNLTDLDKQNSKKW